MGVECDAHGRPFGRHRYLCAVRAKFIRLGRHFKGILPDVQSGYQRIITSKNPGLLAGFSERVRGHHHASGMLFRDDLAIIGELSLDQLGSQLNFWCAEHNASVGKGNGHNTFLVLQDMYQLVQ